MSNDENAIPAECADEVSGLHCILPAGHAGKHEMPGPTECEAQRWSDDGKGYEIVDVPDDGSGSPKERSRELRARENLVLGRELP